MTQKPIPVSAYLSPDLVRWIEEQAAKNTRTKSQQIAHLLTERRAELEKATA